MPKAKIFKPEQFTGTEFSTPSDKAKFANQFVDFVESDFARPKFPKWFYKRLSNCFFFIAHYNLYGFWMEYFDNPHKIHGFIIHCLNYQVCGSPFYTFSDVEQLLKNWLRDNNILERWIKKAREYTRKQELTELARLKAKYETEVQ